MFSRRHSSHWKGILLFAAGAALIFHAFFATRPVFSEVEYRFDQEDSWHRASFPFIVEGMPPGPFQVQFNVQVSNVHPSIFYFAPDDCIDQIIVNNVPIRDRALPFCNFRFGKGVHLGKYLHPGINTIRVHARNNGWPGGLDVGVPPYDPVNILLLVLFACMVGAAAGHKRLHRWFSQASKGKWSTAKEKRQYAAFVRAAIFVFAAVALLRGVDALVARVFYELSNPYTADLGLYLAVGRGIVNGLTPYVDLFENKPPGIFLLSALSLRFFDGPQLLHMVQAVLLVGFPYMFLVWHLIHCPFRWKDLHQSRTFFLLFTTTFFSTGLGLYTMLRSGEAQIESYGAFFGVLYLLILPLRQKQLSWQWVVLAATPILLSVGFKEPFLITLCAAVLVFTAGHLPSFVRQYLLPAAVAAVIGVVCMVILGYLGPYLSIYLREMFGHHLPQSSPTIFKMLAWHRLWFDVKDFATGFVWSLVIMAGYSLFRRKQESGDWGALIAPVGSLVIAISMTCFAVGMTDVYFNHHFIFAVPLYAAIFLRFLVDIRSDASLAGRIVIMTTTVLLSWSMYTHATMNYQGLLAVFAREPVPAQNAAKIIDNVLEACDLDRYMFLGGNGPQPYAYTTHSPLGPLFMQYGYSLSADRQYFRVEFLRALQRAELVVQESYALADLHEQVTGYIEREFTEEPWNCAAPKMRAAAVEAKPYTFYFRRGHESLSSPLQR